MHVMRQGSTYSYVQTCVFHLLHFPLSLYFPFHYNTDPRQTPAKHAIPTKLRLMQKRMIERERHCWDSGICINVKRKAERAYQQLRENIALSQSDTNHELLSFDLEQSLPTPVLTTNVVYYKRQLWTYNLGFP